MDDEARVYELIWKRAVASQMADAKLLRTTVEITAAGEGGAPCVFTASGKVIQFPGYLRAYVEGSDDPAADLGDRETLLPACRTGDRVSLPGGDAALSLLDLSPKSHETTPPPRYTDASLVKRLEDDGIGRPSTYASIIKTILERGYVWRQGKALVPTFTAFVVTVFLKEHFRTLVELDFTGRIEEKLDLISNGDLERLAFLREFYFGDGQEWLGLKNMVEKGRDQRGDYPSYPVGEDPDDGGADRHQGRPLWALRPAGRRGGGEHRVAAGRYRTGRLRVGRGPRAADDKGRRSSNCRRRSEDGDDGVRHDGKVRALRATRRDAGEGEEGCKASEGDEDSEARGGPLCRRGRRSKASLWRPRCVYCRCRGRSASIRMTPYRSNRISAALAHT